VSFYFPDQMFHGRPGHLFPYDVRFEPNDAAHLSRNRDGSLFFRVLTEPGFIECRLITADGSDRRLEMVFTGGRFMVWEGSFNLDAPLSYTFALKTDDGEPVYRVAAGIGNAVERLDRWECDPAAVRRIEVPEWARGAVVYQIFPERFASGDDSVTPDGAAEWGSEPHWLEFQGGDLPGIAEKAGYLSELGVDMVYLNPIFTSPSTHRYDAADFYQVDPALGGNDGLRRLVEAMHGAGIRVVIDASFNHCHPRFFAFADLIEKGEASAYTDWFVIDSYPPSVTVRTEKLKSFRDPATYLKYLERVRDAGIVVVESDDPGPPVEPGYEAWYGVPTLPRINLANPATREYFLDVARYWVEEFDIDGWRMDVARYVDFDFWPEFRRAVKDVKPDAYLLAEIMGDAGPWLGGDTFDATMNYTFRQLCLDFLATDRIDGPGLADGLARMYSMYAPAAAAVSQNLIGSHDTARFLHEADENPDRLRLATVLQMTLPGAPGLYYGDEVGMTGGEEPGSRGAFPWHDDGAWERRQLDTVRSLGSLRRAMPALRHGSLRIVGVSDEAIAFVRMEGDQRVLVAINRSEAASVLSVPIATAAPEVVWGEGTVQALAGSALVQVEAQGAVVVEL
jgi:neopullulanase